jgi:putative GTP pyrophosphokinase
MSDEAAELATTEESSRKSFDYEAHRKDAIDAFAKARPLYSEFAVAVRNIVRDTLNSAAVKVHSIESRAKSLESLGEKVVTPSDSDVDVPKYSTPLQQITDLAGVRVITFFPRTLNAVDGAIRHQFTVKEVVDHTQSLHRSERFGYQSVHYLVTLNDERARLPEYQNFRNLVAEIQIRTVLQHAWAEIEHDIQYKSSITIPDQIRRRFMALAGMLEIADREFQAIQDSDTSLRQEARQLVREGSLDKVEITADALRSYLDKRLGSDSRMSDYSYDWTARLLRRLGFVNFQQVDDCLGSLNDDHLSRAVFGYRQGQLTRFELLLLVSMGSYYVDQHLFAYDWFKRSCERKFEKLSEAKIPIGSYRPA